MAAASAAARPGSVRAVGASLEEEFLRAGTAEDHHATTRLPAEVGAGVEHTPGNMDRLTRGELGPGAVDLHHEHAVDDVNRFRLVGMAMSGQRPPWRR
jgi:hypothetical protein